MKGSRLYWVYMVRIQEWFVIQSGLYYGPHNVGIWNFNLVLLSIDIMYWQKFAPLMLTAKSATRKPTLTAKEHFVYSQILNGQLWSSFALCEVHSNPESSWVTEVAATNAQWTI